jgi:manganese transport protein
MQDYASLNEVHESVETNVKGSRWRRAAAFLGPAYLVSVGYMDPGNWATDLAGGSQFGYSLIWVLLMSNLMALLLQSFSAKLGIVRGRDLAQVNRELYPKSVNVILYLLAEVAIAATDLAEVLGMAIGLNLLTGIAFVPAVLLTVLDTFLLLFLQRLGMRKMEAFIIALVAIIGVSFLIEIILAAPPMGEVVRGFVPHIENDNALYIAIGIIGATVMPHNLYLHSALVQTRKIKKDEAGIRRAIKLNLFDSTIALNLAFFVNAAILTLAATVFFKTGRTEIAEIKDAHALLNELLGSKWAPILFAVALIAAGQSSTITGTLAGQIVMEGYLKLRINPWARRLLTRLLAIVPATIFILINGEKNINDLLIFSQVVLSLQLGFAVIPLIHAVRDKKSMQQFAIKPIVQVLAWVVAAILIGLNLRMILGDVEAILQGDKHWVIKAAVIGCSIAYIGLLIFVIVFPFTRRELQKESANLHSPIAPLQNMVLPGFQTIAIALDFSGNDQKVISHALAQAKTNTRFTLLHIVESASAKLLGKDTDDYEARKDKQLLDAYVSQLNGMGYEAIGVLGYRNRISEIVRIVAEQKADMLVIGSHGHKFVNDLIYGSTINAVRHQLSIPVLIVRTD